MSAKSLLHSIKSFFILSCRIWHGSYSIFPSLEETSPWKGRYVVLNDVETTLTEFQQRLRLNKQTFANLLHQLEPDITPKIPTNNAVAATTKLQCGLRFLASGSLYRLNSDLYGISPASMSRHLFQVVDAIVHRVNHFNQYI